MNVNQMMVSMGNACCPCLHRSENMKRSAVSSASSGSERLSGSGVASSVGYDLDERKVKSNSRMSCASDDSCAINELLEGRMDLNVTLPNGADPVMINVERRTPMLDLLVNISTQNRFTAADYTIDAAGHEFKASTAIGSLDVNQISIIPKTSKSGSLKSLNHSVPAQKPFKTTFRLQVNLPRNQLMVMRVTPNATIAAIKQIICSEKALDAEKYQLVRFSGNTEGPQPLDPLKTLAFYTLNEVTLVSNKTLSQIELQYGTPSASQVDMSSKRTSTPNVWDNKKAINSLIISQSTPDVSTIDDQTSLRHSTSIKQIKKRPAPPPPMPSSATLPNRSMQTNAYKDHNIVTNARKVHSIEEMNEELTQTIIETKPMTKSGVNHIRQNSGSDSSGYHESVLSSSDSPESSSATNLPKSTEENSKNNMNNKQTINTSNNRSGTKKRRAPPPPSGALHVNGINDNIITDESKASHECMSDVSLPLSMSSSMSGTDSSTSSINNRSLSPIVITQTNGSSTPLQRSLETTEVEDKSDESEDRVIVIESNCASDSEHSMHSDNRGDEVDRQTVPVDRPLDNQQKDMELKAKDDSIDENNETLIQKDCNLSDDSQTSQLKVEVNCIAPAPELSHNNSQCAPECSAQVVEMGISNINDKNSELNHISCDEKSDKQISNSNDSTVSTVSSTTINSELDLSELSMPLPPPSPFQNPTYEPSSSSSDSTIGAKHCEDLSNNTTDNNTVFETKPNHCMSCEVESESNTTTTTTTTCPLNTGISEEEIFDKEIEVTLQSLNEELDRLESSDQKDLQKSKVVLNAVKSTAPNGTVESKVIDITSTIENIESKLETRQSPVPMARPVPVNSNSYIDHKVETKPQTKPQTPISMNGKTTIIMNKSQSPHSLSPQSLPSSPSSSPIPPTEEKLSITEEVRQLCRPRVRLTNFSIGSFKKDLDIFEETPRIVKTAQPLTAPMVKSGTKSSETFPSVKKDEKTRPSINKSKINITSTSTTITTTTNPKSSTPVIQTLITSAPKINRIQSWSGQKAVCLEEKNIKPPTKWNQRYVSQIAINKGISTQSKETEEDLKSPNLVVKTLISKTEDSIRNRSPSPKLTAQRIDPIKEHTTISIKPGLNSIIRSNCNQINSDQLNHNSNSDQFNDNRNSTFVSQNKTNELNGNSVKFQTNSSLKSKNILNKEQLQTSTTPSVPPPVPPPMPPPMPPPVPQTASAFNENNSSTKNKTKIFLTKGWNSEKGVRSGEVPKVKHVEPPNCAGVDVRDQLLNEIKNFGGKNTLKKVSKNTSWKLEVNAISAVKT